MMAGRFYHRVVVEAKTLTTKDTKVTKERLRDDYAQALRHGFVEESLAGAVRLDPLTIDDELGDSAFAGALDDLVDGAGGGLDVDLFVGDVVLREKALGFAAVGTPGGGIDDEFHELILEDAMGSSVAPKPTPVGVG